jgi:hypothetical protein
MSVDWPDVRIALDALGLEHQDCRQVMIGPRTVVAGYLARNAEGRLFADEDDDIAIRTLTRQIVYPAPERRFPGEPTPIHDRLTEETRWTSTP